MGLIFTMYRKLLTTSTCKNKCQNCSLLHTLTATCSGSCIENGKGDITHHHIA